MRSCDKFYPLDGDSYWARWHQRPSLLIYISSTWVITAPNRDIVARTGIFLTRTTTGSWALKLEGSVERLFVKERGDFVASWIRRNDETIWNKARVTFDAYIRVYMSSESLWSLIRTQWIIRSHFTKIFSNPTVFDHVDADVLRNVVQRDWGSTVGNDVRTCQRNPRTTSC